MNKKLVLLFILLIVSTIVLTGCNENEIHQKLIADSVVLSDNKLNLVVDSSDTTKVFSTDYTSMEDSCKEIKDKYDYEPFLSHSKEIIISTDIQVNDLKKYIYELKAYHQISPDIKLYLADEEVIDSVLKGDVTTSALDKALENQHCCDERLCHYDDFYSDNEYAVLYEIDGRLEVQRMSI